ncbi:Gfo/Idh/MocA family protein [Pseudogemmobacter bohemicus]|uniref:Gfo/Idh/MocA family protein n=1 Tax=Pseudogemmobacter bohemicus TaxID=2250708 RepID=UPI000DD3C095|nr:Gfo/Idh/MocA family oxidoreductase [Pseudogemmobacter bohemicus]
MGLKVLVVGAGSIGRRHYDNLQALGAEATLRGWRDYGAAGFAAEIAGFDAAVIATATDVRLELIALAAAAEKPLYIEKPLAFSRRELEEIEAVIAPVAQRSVLGYMMRYHPALRALAARDLSGVFQASFSIGHDVTQWRQNWTFSGSYSARAAGGGVLLDLCHELDMAHCLFPGLAVQTVEAQGHAAYPGVDMASRITLSGGGVAAEVAMDYLTPKLHRRTILRGLREVCDFDFAAQRYLVTDMNGETSLDKPLDRNEMFLSLMRDFLALVSGRETSGNKLLPRLDLALPSARLVADAWEARRFIGMIEKEIP